MSGSHSLIAGEVSQGDLKGDAMVKELQTESDQAADEGGKEESAE